MAADAPNFDYSGLSASERLLLARELIDSVLDELIPLTPAQVAEVESRLADFDSGKEVGECWESVKERLRREFK